MKHPLTAGPVFLDCIAEPVIGRRFAPTRWLAMTNIKRNESCKALDQLTLER